MPARVRQALDVESGLNDGLAVPFFLVALDIANAELKTGVTWAVVSNAAAQIGWGLAGGLAAGVLGGLLFRVADRRKWIGGEWRQIVPLAVALLAYAIALHARRQRLHRRLRRRHGVRARLGRARLGRHPFTEETGGFVAAVTWIGFGALALTLGASAHHLAGGAVRGCSA